MWKVVPICDRQLLDVNPKDLLCNGLYRHCNTYKSGGGYDKFPEILRNRKGEFLNSEHQFVVQFKGCPLKCWYCYVTEDGVNGDFVEKSSARLVEDFMESGCGVFHLMGGAPAIYINEWEDILKRLPETVVFHSDLLLLEGEYDLEVLKSISKYKNALYAVSIKGTIEEEFKAVTGVDLDWNLFWRNFNKVVESGIDFYVTFTGTSRMGMQILLEHMKQEYPSVDFSDAFYIPIIRYKASDCFIPEKDNPYLLCVGRGEEKCVECQLRAGWEPEELR